MKYGIQIFAMVGCLLFASMEAAAAVRQGAVYKSGQLVYERSSSTFAMHKNGACDADSDLLFRFTERVEPELLSLNVEQQNATGSIIVEVTITTACFPGSLSFNYGHQAIRGSIGSSADLDISPGRDRNLILTAETGSMQSQQFSYSALNPGQVGSEGLLFELIGGRILFNLRDDEDVALVGSIQRPPASQPLARITVAARGQFVDPSDPGLEQDPRLEDSVSALEQACQQAEESSELEELCRDIEGASGENLARIARAFDPHELAAVPGAANQTAQIQSANVDGRLAALRGGATGLSLDGLSLSMNGMRINAGWLPDNLMRSNNEQSQLLSKQWGFFVNGDISIGKRSDRGKEVGFDFDSWGLTSGIDYRFNNGLVLGGAIGYSAYDADLNQDGGSLEADSWTTQLYGTYDLRGNFYVDATLAFSSIDFEQKRVIDLSQVKEGVRPRHIATGKTDGEQWSTSLSLNYRHVFGNGWQATPYGQFQYTRTDIDGFSEQGPSLFSLSFPDQSFTSQLFSFGVRASRSINLANSVMTPFADLAYEYESDVDGYSMQTSLVVSPSIAGPLVEISNPDRHVGRLDLGSAWVFTNGSQVFVSYSALLFDRDTTRHSLYAGLRLEF